MELQSLSVEERVLLLSMAAPPTVSDLPGELVADALERRDPIAYRTLLAAKMIAVGAPPRPPMWIWSHYAEHYLKYRGRLDQYDLVVMAIEHWDRRHGGPSFHNIATITERGWNALALTRDELPKPSWNRAA